MRNIYDAIIKQAPTGNGTLDKAAGIAGAVLAAAVLLAAIDFISRRVILNLVKKVTDRTSFKWDDMIFGRKVFHKLAHLPALVVLYIYAGMLPPDYVAAGRKLIVTLAVLLMLSALLALVGAFGDIYNGFKFAKERPITGILQVVKVVIIVLAMVVVLSLYIGTGTVAALLGTLGGMTVFITLVFSDSILGLVASIQLTANNALKIGDWLEMPSEGADGEVLEISLNKVKVQNWDKTITHIPTQNFIKESFKNWKGMSEAGGRRIKRAVLLDICSIAPLDGEKLQEMRQVERLSAYIEAKEREIEAHNAGRDGGSHRLNLRRQTNIGLFRAYMEAYLKAHPGVRQDMTLMVRQLGPSEKGMPVEIYCFAATTEWAGYEGIQADIFDHVYAVLPDFGLKPYQFGFDH